MTIILFNTQKELEDFGVVSCESDVISILVYSVRIMVKLQYYRLSFLTF